MARRTCRRAQNPELALGRLAFSTAGRLAEIHVGQFGAEHGHTRSRENLESRVVFLERVDALRGIFSRHLAVPDRTTNVEIRPWHIRGLRRACARTNAASEQDRGQPSRQSKPRGMIDSSLT